MTGARSLTLAVTAMGRVQLASLRTWAAMSGKIAAIREACGCSEGEERERSIFFLPWGATSASE